MIGRLSIGGLGALGSLAGCAGSAATGPADRGVSAVPVLDAAARPPVSAGYTLPVVDLASDVDRQVVVDREEGQYLGHPTTVLLEDGRFEFEGVENVPKKGAAILVFNHRSYFDSTAVGLLTGKADRSARFLGKKEVFDVPVFGRLGGRY